MRKLDLFEKLALKHMNGAVNRAMSDAELRAVIPAATGLDSVMTRLFMNGLVTRHGELWRITGSGIESLLLGDISA